MVLARPALSESCVNHARSLPIHFSYRFTHSPLRARPRPKFGEQLREALYSLQFAPLPIRWIRTGPDWLSFAQRRQCFREQFIDALKLAGLQVTGNHRLGFRSSNFDGHRCLSFAA